MTIGEAAGGSGSHTEGGEHQVGFGKSETLKLRLLAWRSKSLCRRSDQKDFGELLEAFHRSPQRARGEKELGALIAILTKRGMCSDNKEQNMIIGGKVDKRTIAKVG